MGKDAYKENSGVLGGMASHRHTEVSQSVPPKQTLGLPIGVTYGLAPSPGLTSTPDTFFPERVPSVRRGGTAGPERVIELTLVTLGTPVKFVNPCKEPVVVDSP